MIGKLLPILIALIGLAGGIGAGIALRPEPEMVTMDNPCGDVHMASDEKEMPEEEEDLSLYDFAKLNNQFVVPVVRDGLVQSLVVMSLSIQVDAGQIETVYRVEPKLRDLLLRAMFDHANAGGFDGPFTESTRMSILRKNLVDVARKTIGDIVHDVLIIDVVRQDAS